MWKLLNLERYFENKDEIREFLKYTININIDKMNYPQIILMVLNLGLLVVDVFIYKCFSVPNKAYTYLFISHIIVAITCILWIVYYYRIRKKLKHTHNGIIFFIYCNIAFYWCVFMNVNLFAMNKQVSAYVVASFVIASLFYISPSIFLFMQGISYIMMLIALSIVSNNDIGMYNIINLTFTAVFSSIVSMNVFNHYIKGYINNTQIIRSSKRLEKMSVDRTEFLANVSHELRTPLNIIYTSQQMLTIAAEREGIQSYTFDKYMSLIKQNVYRLTRLINNLLDITKIDSSNFNMDMKNTDIIKVVEDITLSTVDYVESKGISLTFDTEEEELIMACDLQCIERIILNLLSNAVKFTDKGGSIFVGIKKNDTDVIITVEDTGVGISDEMYEKIFKRFGQGDKSIRKNNEGTGIGLALVQALVELHNGHIELYSEVNVGSTFIIRLPITIVDEGVVAKSETTTSKRIQTTQIEFSDIYK